MSLDKDAIRKRVEAASPGPWEAIGAVIVGHGGIVLALAGDGGDRGPYDEDMLMADFTAHARQDIEALLSEVDRLESEAAKREERIGELEKLAVRFNDYTHFPCGHVVGKPWPKPHCPICAELLPAYQRADNAEQALELARAEVARLAGRVAGWENRDRNGKEQRAWLEKHRKSNCGHDVALFIGEADGSYSCAECGWINADLALEKIAALTWTEVTDGSGPSDCTPIEKGLLAYVGRVSLLAKEAIAASPSREAGRGENNGP